MVLSRLNRNDKIAFFFIVAFAISFSLIWIFEDQYDKDVWMNTPTERYKMADDIIESQMLLNKSKIEVIELLGEPNAVLSDQNAFVYKLGSPPSFFSETKEHLLVVFTQNSVSKVSLALEED